MNGKLSTEELVGLLRTIDESNLVDVEIDCGDLHVRVRKHGAAIREAAAPISAQEALRPGMQVTVDEKPSAPGRRVELKAPMLGTFYRRPEPGAAPFVEVGQPVRAEDTIGLIEVMKLFNQVQAGVDGKIVEVLVEDAALVEYGQVLLVIETPP
jgi:acetyl-CoA carboxylase biotin carboxyl carrier protein